VVLNDLACSLRAAGDVSGAMELYTQVLERAQRNHYPLRQADAHDGLGYCLVDTAPEQARQHWTLALATYRTLGLPRQHEVAERLAELRDDARTEPGRAEAGPDPAYARYR
jgi:hypothetical protein